MTTNAKTNMTYSLTYIHVPEAYSTIYRTHTIIIQYQLLYAFERMRRRTVICQLSHVYIYIHSAFGVITNVRKRHYEIDRFDKFRLDLRLSCCRRNMTDS